VSAPSTKGRQRRGVSISGEVERGEIEARLSRLQQDDYVMPGWQTVWSEADQCVMVTFQPCHQGMPEAMAAHEFRLWLRGWDARRAAVMARRPRTETIRHGA
jgi:hypothetical protein